MSVFDLTGRKALVTGGAQGLGAGMAEALAAAGAAVVIGDINSDAGKTTVTEQMLCTNVSSSPLIARPDGRQTHAVKLIDTDGAEEMLVKMWVSAP